MSQGCFQGALARLTFFWFDGIRDTNSHLYVLSLRTMSGTSDDRYVRRGLLLRKRLGGERLGGERLGGERLGGERLGGERLGGERLGGECLGGERLGGERLGRRLPCDRRPDGI